MPKFAMDPVIGLYEWPAEWQESASLIVDCVWGGDLDLKPGVSGVDEC